MYVCKYVYMKWHKAGKMTARLHCKDVVEVMRNGNVYATGVVTGL